MGTKLLSRVKPLTDELEQIATEMEKQQPAHVGALSARADVIIRQLERLVTEISGSDYASEKLDLAKNSIKQLGIYGPDDDKPRIQHVAWVLEATSILNSMSEETPE